EHNGSRTEHQQHNAFDKKENPMLMQGGRCHSLKILNAGLLTGHGCLRRFLAGRAQYSDRLRTYSRASRPEAFVVHAAVKAGNIFAVAIKKQCRPPLARAYNLFTRLTPARMWDFRINVRPEPILRGL